MIKSAEFIVSNTKIELCPIDLIPEYAFIGRSNVGKSSLINMICDRKNIAKISKVPGKTKVINHYNEGVITFKNYNNVHFGDIIFRAYNDGIAFRYQFHNGIENIDSLVISDEINSKLIIISVPVA